MIHHIVLFKIKGNSEQDVAYVKKELLSLTQLNLTESFTVYNNYTCNKNKGDLVLDSKFLNADRLQTYMQHAKHLEVIKLTSPFIEEKSVIDFVCD